MDTIKAGKPLCQFIELCYAANRPAIISGQHGIGKIELLEQAAKDMGIGFISRDLSLLEPPDLIGLPKATKTNTIYLPPQFLPTNGKGLLVFEELNRCERYMRAPCLQLLTARTLNDYRLPKGWLPVAAINPPDDDYEVSELDPALLSRFVSVHVEPSCREWLKWARRSGVHASVIRYVQADDSVFDTPRSNPRAWAYVSELLKTSERQQFSNATLRATVLGAVGDERGSAFLQTLKQPERPLTADEILVSYRQHRGDVRRWIKQGHVDLVDLSLTAILKYLQPEAEFDLVQKTKSQWTNLGRFLSDLPGDLRKQAKQYFEERKYPFPQETKGKRTMTANYATNRSEPMIGCIKIAIQRLAGDYPFHAKTLERFEIRCRPDVGTMAGTVVGDDVLLLYNPEFVSDTPADQLVGVLLHEVHHVVFGHLLVDPSDYPDQWARTIAEEVTVNEFITEPLPEGAFRLDRFPFLPPNESSDERYDRITKEKDSMPDYGFAFLVPGNGADTEEMTEIVVEPGAESTGDQGGQAGGDLVRPENTVTRASATRPVLIKGLFDYDDIE